MVGETLKFWLMIAWLLPLVGFAFGILFENEILPERQYTKRHSERCKY